jgi:polysaccharide lyase-like protein
MKTSMLHTSNFFRKNQRVLAVSLLLASLYSCRKGVLEPSAEIIADNTLSRTVTTNSISSLLYNENADGTSIFGTYVSKQTSTSYGITASTTQLYNGTKSARFELRDTDPEIQSGSRAEISFPDATNPNRWYAYALYVPGAQYKDESEDEVISQWHQGGGATPALCLRTKSGHIYLRVMGNTWIDLGAIDKDKWHAYVMHVKHSSGSDGLIEIWRDGQKIVDRSGQNMYPVGSTYHMPNWKLGIYKSDWNGSSTTSTNLRVLYFDDIKMGNEYATYNDMVPVPTATTTTTTTTPTSTTPTTTTTSGQSVVSFNLVNAETEKDVLTITDGQTISLSALKLSKVNIRAVTSTSEPGSVKFQLSGQQSKTYTDDKAPFALHGDNGSGNFFYGNWDPPAPGTYTLKATPYTADNASGTTGASKTITFTITK